MHRTTEKRQLAWWHLVLPINLILIAATAFSSANPTDPSLPGKIAKQLDLNVELNLATWWSSATLLVIALLAYEMFSTVRDKTRFAWLVLAGVFAILSLDEIGGFHERIGEAGWGPFLPFVAVAGVLIVYALVTLFRERSMRRSTALIVLGFALLASIPVHEYLEFALDWSPSMLGVRAALEEGSELFGSFFALWGVIEWRSRRASSQPLTAALPRPSLMQHLPLILAGGLALEVVAALSVGVLTDIPNHGDPSLWFPVALFILLALNLFERARPAGGRESLFAALGLVNLAVSVAIVYIVGRQYTQTIPALLYALVLAWAIFLGWRLTSPVSRKEIAVGVVLSLLLIASLMVNVYGTSTLVASVLALGVTGDAISRRHSRLPEAAVDREPRMA